jgi:cyclopropane-fatty-acyl-phospholipid synthase
MNMQNIAFEKGASPLDIQFHYDLSREFYQIWLDESMTYSAAMYAPGDDLESAQKRKLKYHIEQAEIPPLSYVLDIGCGWGSLMFEILNTFEKSRCVGLTLSRDQKERIDEFNNEKITVALSSWEALPDVNKYDAVVSIGAFEHFARPEMTPKEKIASYRLFFRKISQILKPGHCLSLQTIAFDQMATESFPSWITDTIFPGSILPRQDEILAAADQILSLERLRNDAADYGLTCRDWARRIENNKEKIVTVIGVDKTNQYIRYLRMSAAAFEKKQFGLLRLKFRNFS